jgi:hypothetical protein
MRSGTIRLRHLTQLIVINPDGSRFLAHVERDPLAETPE